MVPVAINAPQFNAVYVDMRMPVPLDIAAPGGRGIEIEVGSHHIHVPAGDGISMDGGV